MTADGRVPRLRALVAIALAAATLALFLPAIGYDFVNFDDDLYVVENPHVASGLTADGLRWAATAHRASNWHPVTWWSLMLDRELFGPRPWGFHLTNVLLHAASAALLFLLWSAWTGRTVASALVAALFALHPLRVESVAWIAERKDVLSLLLGLAALGAYGSWVKRGGASRYAAALALFAVGLAAKPMLVSLPLLLLLLDLWPFDRLRGVGRSERPRRLVALALEKLPFALLAAASAWTTLGAQTRGGAVSTFGALPFAVRAGNAAVSVVAYLRDTVLPAGLAAFYPYPSEPWSAATVAGGVLLLVALSAAAVALARRLPAVAVGWAWYLVTLLPVVGLVQVGSQARADRYTYLPSIGLMVALVWGVDAAAGRLAGERGRRIAAFLGLAAVALLWPATRRQLATWRDGVALFERAVAVTGNNHVAELKLGEALAQRGRLDEALVHYRRSVELRPAFTRGWNDLGAALRARGEAAGALAAFERALELDPGQSEIRFNAAIALDDLGRPADALFQLAQVVASDPAHPHVWTGIAALVPRLPPATVAAVFGRALAAAPDDPDLTLVALAASRAAGDEAAAARLEARGARLSPAGPAAQRVAAGLDRSGAAEP